MEKKLFDFLVPAAASVIFIFLSAIGVFKGLENSVYDVLLHARTPVSEDDSILFVSIDDLSIAKVGTFPWSRDVMADGLIVMKEFDAKYAIFDIEYVNPSPRGVNISFLEQDLPQLFDSEFYNINDYVMSLFDAISTGTLSLGEAQEYVAGIPDFTDFAKDSLLEAVRSISKDNDAYLGQAARFFENGYFTVHLADEIDEELEISEEHLQYVYSTIPLKNVKAEFDFNYSFPAMEPAIRPIMEGAAGAGFVNVIVDDDGVQRRMDLIREHEGHFFGQLGFTPLLDSLGDPQVLLRKKEVVLKGAVMPGTGETRDIVIPLTDDGMVLVNWPKAGFMDSFRHLSYYELVFNQSIEKDLLHNLRIMDNAGYLSFYQGETPLLEYYIYADSLKTEVLEGGDTSLIEEYREIRRTFFQETKAFLEGPAEQEIITYIDQSLSTEGLADEDKAAFQALKSEIPDVFGSTRQLYRNIELSRERLSEALSGSMCFLGWIGTSTTDIGVTPFEKSFMNVGTHGALVNTIVTGEFLDDMPWWIPALVAVVLAFLIVFVIRRLDPLPSILIGVGFLIVIVAGGSTWFLLTGVYLEFLTPLVTVFLSFLVITVFKFLRMEKEKGYIRDAFSHYLSMDVINELLTDPDKLHLGGESKYLTAMFTDIRSFSTVSEKLTATDLVTLLNLYLTDMSNIVLDLKGTIDKYEGDAIICFFGAPIPLEDHAKRACVAAVRMKKIENVLNEHFLNENLSPSPLYTRIGINTGEMVVGNMGTEQKMDYTIMGNSVNLAARLEGVNKQYGTWIMISDVTYEACGKDFTVRSLDRVRVVGIQTPVRLYELIDEKSNTDDKTAEGLEKFHDALGHFEAKDWAGAEEGFKNVTKILPDDGPSPIYLKRCQEYTKKPPPASWDGVFNLTVK